MEAQPIHPSEWSLIDLEIFQEGLNGLILQAMGNTSFKPVALGILSRWDAEGTLDWIMNNSEVRGSPQWLMRNNIGVAKNLLKKNSD